MNRFRAAAIHLGLSVTIATLVFAVIYFVWYPGALFDAAGGRDLFLLIACVDVTIGPLITLIIFVPGKKGLEFDLAVIAILQATALAYGVWVLFESRPVWLVFAKDRFELVRANQLPDEDLAKAKPPFDSVSLTGPRVVGVKQPADPQEQMRIGMEAVKGGRDLQTYPQYYVPYDEVRTEARERAKAYAQLKKFNAGREAEIDALPAKVGVAPDRLAFLPVRAGKRDLAAIVDRTTGDLLLTSNLKPWEY